MNKSKIRKKILSIRNKKYLSKIQIDAKVIYKILKKRNMKKKIIGGYYPFNSEIDILEVLRKFEKKKFIITLPKIRKNNQMDFYDWSYKDPLEINEYGIPETISKKKRYPDILFVPLVAFDKDNNRIGYGGGFYDRYISRIKKRKNFLTIGFAYSFQKVKKIFVEKYDNKLDFVVTEKS